MKSQGIEYRRRSQSRQTQLSFPIKPQERISNTMNTNHLNLPLISLNQVVRQGVERKLRLFLHDQDYNNVKTCCEIDDNHRNYPTISQMTDLEGFGSPKENEMIENYIKFKQQRYDELIERNLDTLRNLEGNSLHLYRDKDLQQTYRQTQKNIQSFLNRPTRMHTVDVNLKDTPEKQQNNNQVFFQKKFKQNKNDLKQIQKTQELDRNLELSLNDSDIRRGQTLLVRNSKPSVINEFLDNLILQKHHQTKPLLKIKNQKLRCIVFVVMAVLELSKKYKKLFQEREIAIEHFKVQQVPHLKYINFFGIKQHKLQYRKFVDLILQKVMIIQKDQKYIKECKTIQKQQSDIKKDTQKQRLCFFIKLLFQDLELITRKNIIPGFIQHCLNLCLFSDKNTQTSQFVINRTKFYSKTIHSLTQEQKVLIAFEFLIFTIIIPNLIDIANELDSTDKDCFLMTLFHFIGIVGVLMVQFTKYYENKFQKITESNVKPIQRVIQLKKNEQGIPSIASISISDKVDENENKIIQGGFEYSGILELFEQKPYWSQKISQQFSRIATNIGQIIDITNVN